MSEAFTFFSSYWSALKKFSKKTQLEIFTAMCEYGIEDREPNLSKNSEPIFALIRPTMCKGKARSNAARQAKKVNIDEQMKSKRRANEEQMKSNGRANEEQMKSHKDKDIGYMIKDKDIGYTPLPPNGELEKKQKTQRDLVNEKQFSMNMKEAVLNWLQYKLERKETYKETGLKMFLNEVEHNATKHGESRVIAIINYSMSNNWKGILWDKILTINIQTPSEDKFKDYYRAQGWKYYLPKGFDINEFCKKDGILDEKLLFYCLNGMQGEESYLKYIPKEAIRA